MLCRITFVQSRPFFAKANASAGMPMFRSYRPNEAPFPMLLIQIPFHSSRVMTKSPKSGQWLFIFVMQSVKYCYKRKMKYESEVTIYYLHCMHMSMWIA